MTPTAVVVDDHPMCRQATRMALEVAHPGVAIHEASTFAEAREQAEDATLMVLDLALPDSRGPLAVAELLSDNPALRLLVVSGATNPQVEQHVAEVGAQGFVSKAEPITTMVDAMRAVMAGGRWFSRTFDRCSDSECSRLHTLTAAQRRMLDAMAGGRLNKQIAYDLGLSEITVKAHVKAVLKKLAVPNRTQAVLLLQRVQA